MEFKMTEATYHLDFEGYWTEGTLGHIPPRSGVYCVYECSSDDESARRLLFIGEGTNVQDSVAKNDAWDEWTGAVGEQSRLCFSFAHVDAADRHRVHASLIFEFNPPLNKPYVNIIGVGRPTSDEVNFFPFEKTTLELSGKIDLLKERFTIEKREEANV